MANPGDSFGDSPKSELKEGTLIRVLWDWDKYCQKGDVMMVLGHHLKGGFSEDVGWLTCLVPRLMRKKTFNDNYFGSHWEIVDINERLRSK